MNITGDGSPEPVTGLRASDELMRVLGVSPAIGRTFNLQEQHGGAAVAVISYGLWTRRYGNDPRILSRTILLNEVSHSVIGVLILRQGMVLILTGVASASQDRSR